MVSPPHLWYSSPGAGDCVNAGAGPTPQRIPAEGFLLAGLNLAKPFALIAHPVQHRQLLALGIQALQSLKHLV